MSPYVKSYRNKHGIDFDSVCFLDYIVTGVGLELGLHPLKVGWWFGEPNRNFLVFRSAKTPDSGILGSF